VAEVLVVTSRENVVVVYIKLLFQQLAKFDSGLAKPVSHASVGHEGDEFVWDSYAIGLDTTVFEVVDFEDKVGREDLVGGEEGTRAVGDVLHFCSASVGKRS